MRAKKISKIISYKDIFLKLLTPKDVSGKYVGWMNNREVTKFIENKDKNNTLEKLKKYVSKMHESLDNYLFGIYLIATNEYIGNIKVGNIHPQHLRADVGLMIGEKKYWGKGYGNQAIAAVANFAFTELKLNKLFAMMVKTNPGSFHAFLKAGFTHVGTFKKHAKIGNTFVDTLIVEVLQPH